MMNLVYKSFVFLARVSLGKVPRKGIVGSEGKVRDYQIPSLGVMPFCITTNNVKEYLFPKALSYIVKVLNLR